MKLSGIYVIIDGEATPTPLKTLAAALAAGVAVVQYRAKTGIDRVLLRAMLELTRRAGVPLIVNDDLEAAIEADGWHAGQEDLAGCDAGAIRKRLGSRLFGISVGTPEEAPSAEAAGADYFGTGPFAATLSKADAGDAIGAAGVARVVAATRLPVVAIGGIDLSNLPEVAESGASMAAVISAVAGAPAPEAAARALVTRWRELRG